MFKSCSPYLKMFNGKGVNWHYSLTNELLNIAQEEDKLIFLHIGYISNINIRESSLELFAKQEVISLLNKNFICIIEDKEDKPESFLLALDLLFLNQDFSYGPMNMFIMPNRRPLIAFSDCDPDNFLEIANSLLLAKKEKREKLKQLSEELSKRAINTGIITDMKKDSVIEKPILEKYVQMWFKNMFDTDFIYKLKPFTPNPASLYTIIEYLRLYPDKRFSDKMEELLNHMQYSALFDVIDGGFFRQAIDYSCNKALYEKSLEENSLFLMLYSAAYKLYGNESYKVTSLMTYNFILNELLNDKGALVNSTTLMGKIEDAVYYSYSVNELSIIFPERYSQIAIALGMDMTQNRMEKQTPVRGADTYIYISEEDIDLLRQRRLEHRGYYKDTRVITASNSVTATAFSIASIYLQDPSMYNQATKIFEYLLFNNIDNSDGRLYRYTCCSDSYLIGYLSDYAHFIEASLELYKNRFDTEYLMIAKRYTEMVMERFYKPENGMFSKSERDFVSDTVPFKRESNIDFIRPSANSVMAGNLISLYEITAEERYITIAKQQLNNIVPNLLNSGPMLSSWAHKILKYINIDVNPLSKEN
ncbi:MAG: hypothetical protein A2X17_04825 [Bacteroidetes bacterium GWF2_41_61]|nr:MAG: hypothetical protein A2X20_05860 [Bacteroidetes bacterium GWE2_40_15]OFY29921.1 MAG: hypothetical protein A2X17_04825 [Bacteroidetes bacterium GWF2_41_61]OFY91001.1 MAG: hypothetical protein A2266_03130 [Bacteroidetes bacterium RIFOXYA12_FULL_40_10]HBG24579.1 hypothetical protein [Rikenellaceae bacterium]HBZ26378.1 hypothetical protein [Rikenellaceae bacterium]